MQKSAKGTNIGLYICRRCSRPNNGWAETRFTGRFKRVKKFRGKRNEDKREKNGIIRSRRGRLELCIQLEQVDSIE